jgi:hypothetical protein
MGLSSFADMAESEELKIGIGWAILTEQKWGKIFQEWD